MSDLSKLLEAASFAAKRHKNQKRKGADGEPYINHPLEVAKLLANVGKVEDTDVLIAALLHDTVEDTETTREEITQMFGERVSGMVLEVTDDKSLPKAERKQLQVEHAPHLSPGAKLVKLGDKISNITDIMNNPPRDWSLERKLEYIAWGERVVAGLRGANTELEKHFDQTAEKARQKFSD
ncbi:MAG TPA: HD domain-containing protein [Pyrinomonadaceae bacterium]|nr:HD domain-containing protein [Pyrinomonadaceae bacterium]